MGDLNKVPRSAAEQDNILEAMKILAGEGEEDLKTKTDVPGKGVLIKSLIEAVAEDLEKKNLEASSEVLTNIIGNYDRNAISKDRKGRGEMIEVSQALRDKENGEEKKLRQKLIEREGSENG